MPWLFLFPARLPVLFLCNRHLTRLFHIRLLSSDVKDVQSGSRVTWSGVELLQSGRDLTTKVGGTTLASACALCLDLLLYVWLRISGGQNYCQEIRREVVYRLIGVEMDIKDVNDFNL